MYACAKQLESVPCQSYFPVVNDNAAAEKTFIRGTVTDGHNWIFLVLKMNANGDGAIYAQSLHRIRLMTVVPPGDEEISRTMCDVIAGIITYWVKYLLFSSVRLHSSTLVSGMVTQIEHSNEDIGDDDWFRAEWK